MSNGLNSCEFIGNFGADPALRAVGSTQVAEVGLGVSEAWRDKQTGEKKERTEWVRLAFWDKLADIVEQFTHKGSRVYVEGKLQTDKYTDKDGVERYVTKVRVSRLILLDSAGQSAPRESHSYQQGQHRAPVPDCPAPDQGGFTDDEIPFN